MRQKERKSFKQDKKIWEEVHWLQIVDEVKESERRGDTRTLYKKLRDIGLRGLKTIEEEKFAPEEYRNHLKTVFENRFEKTIEELMTTARECTTLVDN